MTSLVSPFGTYRNGEKRAWRKKVWLLLTKWRKKIRLEKNNQVQEGFFSIYFTYVFIWRHWVSAAACGV